jgi:hypothetical protein
MHEDKICESFECEPRKCKLGHPKVCSFFRNYKFCKFAEYCSFSHNICNNSNDGLEKEISDIKRDKENEYDNQKRTLETEIIEREILFQNFFNKFEESVEKIGMLEKKVKMVEEKNNFLQSKVEMFEKSSHTSSEFVSCNICDLIFETKL